MKSNAVLSCHASSSRSLTARLGAVALTIVITATQMPAQSAVTAAQDQDQQKAASSQSWDQAVAQIPAMSTSFQPVATGAIRVDSATLPDAPAAAREESDSASLAMPPKLKAMMDDAGQEAQNLQSASSSAPKEKLVQRPGMLILGIAGVPLIVLGTMIFSLNVGSSGKANGLRNGLGTAFLAPGAAMAGFGFYFAFHKKSK